MQKRRVRELDSQVQAEVAKAVSGTEQKHVSPPDIEGKAEGLMA